ncbi:MAG: glycerol-3-phosphate 1-O-acyltransferase PlsY [Akkermansiaceae bacterium]|nr:glycerol-3-phosphate 1-O-acyltransferase PlsY [Akkermansiaceae bacterium]
MPLSDIWPILAAYAIGATPCGFLIAKLRGIDIRAHGSGNIGATNVLRVLGKPIGVFVLVLDVLKGLLPVLLAKAASEHSIVHILAAVATILGHNYTFWLGFKGGKGIATSAGAMLPLIPIPLAVALSLWGLLFGITRYVSVGSIFAALSLPVTEGAVSATRGRWDWPIFGFTVFLAVMATWRHKTNIRRLLAGEEARFEPRKKKAEKDAPPTEDSQTSSS